MILNRLSIVNYKNIHEAELLFSRKLNCFFGDNGMGKTNLLDALYYLSFCKSQTNLPDSQNILHGEDFFVIQGMYDFDGKEEEIYCGLKRKQKKQFKRNKKEYEKLSDHIGTIPLVMVSPADAALILGGSEERRKFMDLVIAQYDKAYMGALISYNRALAQRNALLKEGGSGDHTLYELWEEVMDSAGRVIYLGRCRFLEEFIPVFREYYKYVSGDAEEVSLDYSSHLSEGELFPMLEATRERDKLIGFSTKGVHKDDLEMLLDTYPIKKIGSQGQNKTYLIALKLAQFEFLKRIGHTTPILLLDDIFDKLDAHRVEQIVHLVAGDQFGQIFITDTNRKYLDEILAACNQDYLIFRVQNGEVAELEKGAMP